MSIQLLGLIFLSALTLSAQNTETLITLSLVVKLIFGLDFPLGVQTLVPALSLMIKIECAEMCCNCAEKCCKCAEMLWCCKCAANMLKTCCKCATIVLKCSDSANMLQMCCKRVANVLQLRWNVLELQMYCKCATIVLKCSGAANVLKCYSAS